MHQVPAGYSQLTINIIEISIYSSYDALYMKAMIKYVPLGRAKVLRIDAATHGLAKGKRKSAKRKHPSNEDNDTGKRIPLLNPDLRDDQRTFAPG